MADAVTDSGIDVKYWAYAKIVGMHAPTDATLAGGVVVAAWNDRVTSGISLVVVRGATTCGKPTETAPASQ